MWIEIAGWGGLCLLLAAYFLVSSKKITIHSNIYYGFNLIGSIGILVNAYVNRSWPIVALEIIWALIAAKGMAQVFWGKPKCC